MPPGESRGVRIARRVDAGTGTDWTWMPSGQVTFEALGKRARWCVEAERIGVSNDTDTDTDAEAAFHVIAPG